MFNFVMFSAVFVFSVTICRFTFVTSGINSCLNAFDFTVAQSTVVVPYETGTAPYFDEDAFKGAVYRHFEKNVQRYLTPFDKYSFSFYFEGDYLLQGIKTEKYRAYVAGFTFYCDYLGFASYKQEKRFAIEVGNTYEN